MSQTPYRLLLEIDGDIRKDREPWYNTTMIFIEEQIANYIL